MKPAPSLAPEAELDAPSVVSGSAINLIYASLAQWTEQKPSNLLVTGSTPVWGTI